MGSAKDIVNFVGNQETSTTVQDPPESSEEEVVDIDQNQSEVTEEKPPDETGAASDQTDKEGQVSEGEGEGKGKSSDQELAEAALKATETTEGKPDKTKTEAKPEDRNIDDVIAEIGSGKGEEGETTPEIEPQPPEQKPKSILADLQKERKKRQDEQRARQEAEQKATDLETRLQRIEQGLAARTGTIKKPTTAADILEEIRLRDGLQPDDVLTFRQQQEFEAHKAALEADNRKTLETQQEKQRQQVAAQVVERFEDESAVLKERLSPSKVGAGRDFETVLSMGRFLLTPEDISEVSKAPNMALKTYQLCVQRIVERSPGLRSFYNPKAATGKQQEPKKPTSGQPGGKPKEEVTQEGILKQPNQQAVKDYLLKGP